MKRLFITTGFIILFSYCAISQEQKDSISTINKTDYGFYHPIGDSIVVENPLTISEQDEEIDLRKTELLNRNVTMLGVGNPWSGLEIEYNVALQPYISHWAKVANNLYVIPKFSLVMSKYGWDESYLCLTFSGGKKFIMDANSIFYTSLGILCISSTEIFKGPDKLFLPEFDIYLSRKIYENIYINLGLNIVIIFPLLSIGVSF